MAPPPVEVEVTEHTPNSRHGQEYLEFTVRNVDNSFANGLRRVLLSEIPTLAIELVEVRANTSCYHDELLVHRMGLIPFASEFAEHLLYTRDCNCKQNNEGERDGCDRCQVVVKLKKRCTEHMHSLPVYSSDIELDADHPDVRPVSDSDKGIWLFTLGRGQEVHFTCKVRKGIAKIHSRWMAVATVAMQYKMDVIVNKPGISNLPEEDRKLWVSKCPANVFAYDDVLKQVDVVARDACIYCQECVTLEKPFDKLPAPLVSVRPKKNQHGQFDVVFKVETTGALPARTTVQWAINMLRRKLTVLRTALLASNQAKLAAQAAGGAPVEDTRPIGTAPTAVRVPNQEAVAQSNEDDLQFVMK